LLTHLIKLHRHCFIRDRHRTDKRKEKQSELVVADVAIAVLVNDMDGVLQVDEPIPVHVHNPEEKGPTKHRKYQHEYREPQSGRRDGICPGRCGLYSGLCGGALAGLGDFAKRRSVCWILAATPQKQADQHPLSRSSELFHVCVVEIRSPSESGEQLCFSQHFACGNAERIHVVFLRIRWLHAPVRQNLWRSVVGRIRKPRRHVGVENRAAEVGDLRAESVLAHWSFDDEDVCRFQIAVHYAMHVQEVETGGNILNRVQPNSRVVADGVADGIMDVVLLQVRWPCQNCA
jgi:hypothetical protein